MTPAPVLDFIPVELLRRVVTPSPPSVPDDGAKSAAQLPQLVAEAEESWAERTSLFGELEA
jgi:hypothetical protein